MTDNIKEYSYVSSFSPMAKSFDGLGITILSKTKHDDSWKTLQRLNQQNASWMTFDPTHKFLYVCYSLRDSKGKVYGRLESYQIDANTYFPSLLNTIDLDSGPAHMAVSPDGKSLIVANYYPGNFTVYDLKSDGQIGGITDQLTNFGNGPHERQESPHPHAVVFDDNGPFIGVTDLGNDTVAILKLTNKKLIRISQTTVPSGMGPRHLIFSPNHSLVYVIGELDGHLLSLEYNHQTGELGKIVQNLVAAPDTYTGIQSGAEIQLHPNKKFLYVSNRGPHALMTYKIDQLTGKLALTNTVTDKITNPTGFTIDPQGTHLYVPNNGGQDIIQFSINSLNGSLTATNHDIPLLAPNIMIFL